MIKSLLLFPFFLLATLGVLSAEGSPSKTFTNSIGMEFVLIPAGQFQMGLPETMVYKCSDCQGSGKRLERRAVGSTPERRCNRCAGKGETICDGDYGRPHYVDKNDYTSVCTKCNGTGRMICPTCGGSGHIQDTKYVDFYISCNTCSGTGKIEVKPQDYLRERPVHTVRISRPFYLGKYEVTQAQWMAVMGDNPSHNQFHKEYVGDDKPVTLVSWNDVQKFIAKLNILDPDKNYRLPTEAEWEYACRAGSMTVYYWGDKEGRDYCVYCESGGGIHSVGQKQPNAWVLYDMSGNVWEWCADWHGEYSSEAVADPTGPAAGTKRVMRGGGLCSGLYHCRSSSREAELPDYKDYCLGFRLARSLP